ncbi:hypothetical protein BY458DRAFT_61981 [Sporodiniella umbellata]|nr:hypothetical protein BY458DRAFT_61981 [Sporodiniella umbellata]
MGEHNTLEYQQIRTNETNIPPFSIQYSIDNMNTISTISPEPKKLVYTNSDLIYEPSVNQYWPCYFPTFSNDCTLHPKEQSSENDVQQRPQHIVSPEAIREAQKEETDWPFSNFSTLFALKQQGQSGDSASKVNSCTPLTKKDSLVNNINSFFSFDKCTATPPPNNSRALNQKDSQKSGTQENCREKLLSSEAAKKRHKPNSDEEEFENTNSEKSYGSSGSNKPARRRKARKSNLPEGQKDPRGRKKKISKHPYAPKHPMSAYLYYLIEVYPKVSLNFPGSTVGPISKSISATWHAMSIEERVPWQQKAKLDKARYAQELKVYMEKCESEQASGNSESKLSDGVNSFRVNVT